MTTTRTAHVTTPDPTRSDEAGSDTGPGLPADVRRGLEAILFLADEPVDIATLAEVAQAPVDVVQAEVDDLAATYQRDGRGMEIRAAGGGWRMYTAAASQPTVERWALAGRTGRLTQAALETLAVIAYKQPISRHRVGDIRGVNADAAVRSLVARGLVTEVGRDPGPGQAVLYGTTTTLLERLGLDALDELPPLTDFLPDAPAPDEPDLGALKEIRRRLARGGDLAGGDLRGPPHEPDAEPDEDRDDALPPPIAQPAGVQGGEDIDELTERLETAARKAVDRLRAAVTAEHVDASEAPREDARADEAGADHAATTDDELGHDSDDGDAGG